MAAVHIKEFLGWCLGLMSLVNKWENQNFTIVTFCRGHLWGKRDSCDGFLFEHGPLCFKLNNATNIASETVHMTHMYMLIDYMKRTSCTFTLKDTVPTRLDTNSKTFSGTPGPSEFWHAREQLPLHKKLEAQLPCFPSNLLNQPLRNSK